MSVHCSCFWQDYESSFIFIRDSEINEIFKLHVTGNTLARYDIILCSSLRATPLLGSVSSLGCLDAPAVLPTGALRHSRLKTEPTPFLAHGDFNALAYFVRDTLPEENK